MTRPLALALLLLGTAAAQPREAVNRLATVQSADGHLNLREGPTSETRVVYPLRNGQRVLVLTCQDRPRGRRWCHVLMGDDWEGGFRFDAMYGVGYVYDAELVYDRDPAPVRTSAAGAGVAPGFEAVARPWEGYRVVDSVDGYVNLRAGPGTDAPVLTRMRNGAEVMAVALESGAGASGRWALVYVVDGDGEFGYAFDAELAADDHEH